MTTGSKIRMLSAWVLTAGVCASASADIVINEIMQNPAAVSDARGEWIELFNSGDVDVDINGWTLADDDSDSHVIDAGAPIAIAPGAFLILGNNGELSSNGGVTVDYSYGSSWFIANGADEIVLLDAAGQEIDRVAYDGGPLFPDPNGASMALISPDVNNAEGGNWCESTGVFGSGDRGTPGAVNDCEQTPPPPPEPEQKLISEIQGSGSAVTMPGATVSVEAVVTGDYQGNNQLRGFFIQEEAVEDDGDPMTSEGIFVYCGACSTAVDEGDLVKVTGVAEEFFGMSQLNVTGASGEVVVAANDQLSAVSAAPVSLPASDRTDDEATFESLEGMLVRFTHTLTVTEYYELARFGQLVLSADGKQHQFTHLSEPSVEGYENHLRTIESARIVLDDLNNRQNDSSVYHPQPGGFSVDHSVRGGYQVQNLTGVMHWSYPGSGPNTWRIRPQITNPVQFIPTNPRRSEPENVGGDLRIASFNVLNYFTTIDTTSSNSSGYCGADGQMDCRGADSTSELIRQTRKIVSALLRLDADIVGLIEIENNESASMAALVGALNDATAPGTYAYVDSGLIGTDAIKVGIVYKPASVQPVGDYAVLDSRIDPTFLDHLNRPVLIQSFEQAVSGSRLTVAVNHLKSKGSDCDSAGDPDKNDGQGNCNLTRARAMESLVNYLATDPTGSGDPDVLILGDLNAYAKEDPLLVLQAAGYENLLARFMGDDAYSYVFDGQWGYLDHALANSSLASQVTGASVWHINADEVNLLDYNDTVRDGGEASYEAKPDANELYGPDAYRSSDHDPVLIGLDISPEAFAKDDCKKGEWQFHYRADNSPFKNQGDCVSYTETGK